MGFTLVCPAGVCASSFALGGDETSAFESGESFVLFSGVSVRILPSVMDDAALSPGPARGIFAAIVAVDAPSVFDADATPAAAGVRLASALDRESFFAFDPTSAE